MPVAISLPISSPPAFHHLLFDLPEPEPPSVIHVRPQASASPCDLGFGILSHYCGPELIDRVLAQHGRAEQRCRLLPLTGTGVRELRLGRATLFALRSG